MFYTILNRADLIFIRNIPGNANRKQIPNPLIEEDLGNNPGIRAA
jgi:hypothetical protein